MHVVYQAVKGLLYLLEAGIQPVEEQHIGFLPDNHAGRKKLAAPVHNLGYTDDVRGVTMLDTISSIGLWAKGASSMVDLSMAEV